jgi:NitT/TauT family transport system substrate-binding protein
VEEGKIRVIARGSEIKARADQTVRVCIANAQVLGKRANAVARFVQGYRDAIDWMYADPAALQMYEAFSNVRHELMAKVRDQYFPKPTLWPDEVRGLDLVLSDALKNRFIARPLTPAETKEMIQIPAPM